MLGLSPVNGPNAADLPPEFDLSSSATQLSSMESMIMGKNTKDGMPSFKSMDSKAVPRAPVPHCPPCFDEKTLVGTKSGIGIDEAYSNDEKALNEFLKLHPMLSMEATSQRTLQMLSGMFEKASMNTGDLPVIGKSYDDQFLRPASETIGERPCINGDACLAQFVAKMRYGADTNMAFTCTEFLLPEARKNFLNGNGLPSRKGKCLMCMRYFQSYVYLLARTDPAFKIGETPLSMQVFSNAVFDSNKQSNMHYDDAQLRAASTELPTHASIVSTTDGYKPSAMLFVDEDWSNLRSSREGNLGKLLWKPVVRFCSTHYKYVRDIDGPRIVQVGVSADDKTDGLNFGQPPARKVAEPGAEPKEERSH
tara:strand:- start:10523 stop:11617 length:1095 start_codon:yes stop_codon:yes gene_type:complete